MKKLILVASPPACGKTYVSERIAKEARHIVYLDKDDLSEIVRAAFKCAGEKIDMDGDFYKNNIRPAEYATIMNIVFSSLRFEDTVLINAPFGNEVRDIQYMKNLKEKANGSGAEVYLIWVTAPLDVCHARMKNRNSDRDTGKLNAWEDYVKKINYAPPFELEEKDAVDKLIVFDNSGDEAFERHLKEVIDTIFN